MHPSNLRQRSWLPPRDRAGLPPIRFHDLRHTAASLALSAGVNVKVVSEMLGHASTAMTLEVYAHTIPGMQKQAADARDAILEGVS